MRRLTAFLLLATLMASCGGTPVQGTRAPPGTMAPPATTAPPAVVPSGDPVGPPLQLEVDGFRFELIAIGAECARLEITTPDDRLFALERCFHQDRSVDRSPHCLRFDDTASSATFDSVPMVCDVEAPTVTYGRVIEGIGHVCVPEFYEAGFGFVRFLEWSETRLILLDPSEAGGPSHHYTEDGRRFGSEPLDAPSRPIYEMCERLAPWRTGNLGPSEEFRYRAPIVLDMEEPDEVADRSVTLSFGSEGYISYLNGEERESSLGFLPFPVTPTLSIENVRAELAPLDPAPDLDRRWQLVVSVDTSGVQPDGKTVTIDPDGVRLIWVER